LNQAMYGLQGQEAQAQGKVDMQRLSDQANIQRAQMANQSAQLQDALKLRQAEVAQQSAQNAQQYKMQLMQAQSGSPLNQLKYENALATLQGKTNALNRPPVSGMGMGAVDQFMQQNNITPESPEYLTFQALMGQTDPSKSIDQNYQQLLQSEPTEGQNQLNLITSKEYPAMQGQGGVAIHPEVSGYAGTNSNGEMPTISDPTVQQMLGLFYGKSKNTR